MKEIRANVSIPNTSSYKILIGNKLVDNLVEDLRNGLVPGISKYAIITDDICKKIIADEIYKKLKAFLDISIFTFPNGEKSKTRYTKIELEDKLIENGFRRDTCIISVGGGVVSDLVGFLAGTYCRGVPFISFSTTFLSAADASIGGKTGVDTDVATNLIGLFYSPVKVYIDYSLWKSLSYDHVLTGMAETIKHACIADYDFFLYLEQNINKLLNMGRFEYNEELLEYIAIKNCQIKQNVVEEDFKESNLRQILNFGHTIGRAIEPLSDFSLLHGHAVAIGIVAALRIELQKGFIKKETLDRVINLFKSIQMPVEIPEGITKKQLIEKMHTDKKSKESTIRFVFIENIGKIKKNKDSYSHPIADEQLESLLKI